MTWLDLFWLYLAGAAYHLAGLGWYFLRSKRTRLTDLQTGMLLAYWSAFWFIASPVYLIYRMGRTWNE